MQNVIVECLKCGQRNRMSVPLPTGKVAVCGQCRTPLGDDDPLDPDDLDTDDDDDDL